MAKGKGLGFTHPPGRADEQARYEATERLKRLPKSWAIKVLSWTAEGIPWREIIKRLPTPHTRETAD